MLQPLRLAVLLLQWLPGGAFVLWKATIDFIIIFCGGAVIGLLLAYVFVWLLEKIKFTSTATVSLNILMPFLAYQVAESLEFSGVLAVVTAGLVIARKIHNGKLFSGVTIIQSKSGWSVIIYVMNGLIFILIGLEFPQALEEIPDHSFWPLIISSFAIFFIALGTRILIIFERKFRIDKTRRRGAKRHGENKEMGEIRTIDWKNALIIGWSGMRGIVSIATAIALPLTFDDGSDFPERSSIIFLTVMVVIIMLFIQGLGLPLLIKILKIKPQEENLEM